MAMSRDSVRIERTPSSADQNFGWTIKRATHEHPTLFTCLSNDFFGIRTHFFRGRTGPCLKTECEACTSFRDGQDTSWPWTSATMAA